MVLTWVYLLYHGSTWFYSHSTMGLVGSAYLQLSLPLALLGSVWLHALEKYNPSLPWLYLVLPGCTWLYDGSSWLYFALPWLYSWFCWSLLDCTSLYHGPAWLCQTLVIALLYAAELVSNLPHSTMALSDSTRVYPTLSLLYLVLYWNLLPLSTMAGFTGLHLTFLQSVMAPRSITGLWWYL